jgi:hypothetical protein
VASTIELKYGTNGQTVTCTLASLANTAARGTTVIDNTSNLYEDVPFQLTVKSGASGVSATGIVNVYATGTVDGGTTYGEGAGSDAAVTLTVAPNVKLIGTINVVANATTYKYNPMPVSPVFGGTLFDHIGFIIENKSGAALDATEANHVKKYQGVQHQST